MENNYVKSDLIHLQKAEIERLTKENRQLSLKVWNYEQLARTPLYGSESIVHCNLVTCYNENTDLKLKNAELQKQVDKLTEQFLETCKNCHLKKDIELLRYQKEQIVEDTTKEIFKEIFESVVFNFKGNEDYKKGFCDALAQYDKQLRDLAKLKGVEVE